MIVNNYWPYPVGGMEKQCRRLVHAFHAENLAEVTVITSRHTLESLSREHDEGSMIIRCIIFQPVIDFLLRIKNRFKSKKENPSCSSNASLEEQSKYQMATMAEKGVYWLNAFVFMLSAGYAVFRQRRNIDIIHVQSTEWINGFAVLLGRFLRKPVVAKEASYPPFRPFEFHVPFHFLLNRCRYQSNYFALTSSVAEEIKNMASKDSQVFTIPNGVDIPVEPASLDQGNIVLWVGNVSRGILDKGLDVLIEAWAIVQKELPGVRLLLVGGGSIDLVREFAAKHDVGKNIEFPGYTTDIGNYYRAADMVVSASRSEGMSNVLLEAQAYGLPVVVSDIPGNNDIVIDGINGLLFPSENVKALASAILVLLADVDMRKRMGKTGRNRVRNLFSFTSISTRVLDAYNELV